jgi:A/G-specific adenine glycosylase
MLQQTVVKAVIDHYTEWVELWPDVAALAGASEREVTRSWEGLGYYSRARNLLAASQEMVSRFDGRVPDDYADLRSLPGIGDYTARAILSIGYGKAYHLVDANVRRILQRRHLWPDWDRDRRTEAQSELEELLPKDRPGDFNQALMELGQKICTKKSPLCPVCPVGEDCEARRRGVQGQIPRPRQRPVTQRESRVIAYVREGSVWVCRPGEGLFGGLWMFPRVELNAHLATRPTGHLRPRTHTYTRYRERLYPEIHYMDSDQEIDPDLCDQGGEWLDAAALRAAPLPSVHRLIARDLVPHLVGQPPAQSRFVTRDV